MHVLYTSSCTISSWRTSMRCWLYTSLWFQLAWLNWSLRTKSDIKSQILYETNYFYSEGLCEIIKWLLQAVSHLIYKPQQSDNCSLWYDEIVVCGKGEKANISTSKERAIPTSPLSGHHIPIVLILIQAKYKVTLGDDIVTLGRRYLPAIGQQT